MNSKINIMQKFSILFSMIILFYSCSSKIYYPNYQYETNIVEVGKQGTIIVKAWGKARKVEVAKENARKNAVYAYLFKGFSSNSNVNSSDLRQLLNSDIEIKHKDYFNDFFKENGIYLKFVNYVDETGNIGINDRIKEKGGYKIGIVVCINKSLLISELENAGIKSKFGIN